ncbi:MAG: phosphoribosylglycinamide formyltransferase [Pseudomonadota bacterium]
MSRARVGILISGGGSNMQALVRAMQAGAVPGLPALVIANRPDVEGLGRAAALGVPAESLDHRAFADRAAFDAALSDRLRAASVSVVCLAGFMRVLGPAFVAQWQGRLLNIHPSLLPLFPGRNTHARALQAGMAVHGATVHAVTEALDAGPILGQTVVPVKTGDTPQSLAARLLPAEHRLYPETLARFLRGRRDPLALIDPEGWDRPSLQ